jgi:hypothetical protein
MGRRAGSAMVDDNIELRIAQESGAIRQDVAGVRTEVRSRNRALT